MPAANDAGAEARIEPSPDHAEEAFAELDDDAIPTRGYTMVPMVGLGGSAGGLVALKAFFETAPVDTGMAFVVVMHLAADHESLLAQILQRSTTMPVKQVVSSVRVEANHIYVIAPGKAIVSANGHLTCSDLTPERSRHVTVDLFFRTLADTHGPRAAAIVLSGADGDGAIGIKRIKERGGLTIAQDPDEAEHSSMPRAAISTGMVDWVLPVAEMAARLGRYNEALGRLKLPPEDGPQPALPAQASDDENETALREVLAYLRSRTGRDFSYYKRSTILRRIGRRMSVSGIEDLPAYLSFIRTHPGEAGALLQDLLISVTNFFRDPDAFDALWAQIPALFAGKTANDELRVWVAACASGEEAYSIAMLLVEHARTLDAPPAIQVFATDLDEQAIRLARNGFYPLASAADLSEERLRRFFTKEQRGYRVRGEIRETVLFAIHDLLKDAPFSRIDLFTCRNLMIYLNGDAQKQALGIAQFALRPNGRLFLGASETVDGSEHLFQAIDKKHRIYEPRRIGRQRLPAPSGDSTLARALELQERSRDSHLPGLALPHRFATAAERRPGLPAVGIGSWRELHLKMIERLAPPSVVVTEEHEIVHLSDGSGRFLRYSGGELTSNLLSAVDPRLSVDLRTALLRAVEYRLAVETAPIDYLVDGLAASVVIRVAPADDLLAGFLLVTFDLRPAGADADADAGADASEPVRADPDRLLLQRQVDELKWHLRDITEQGNTATQELKASNEELQAMNEELRSATEELETSREELQSINEELTTVNIELKGNVEELAQTNGDLHNLMASTAIATVFLDRSMRITLFTPPAVELFNLIPSDIGRPLGDLTSRLDYPEILSDVALVLERLAPVEREVRSGSRRLLARILAYRDDGDKIAGIVLTLLDITARVEAETARRESESQYRAIFDQAAAGVVHTDLDGRITLVNPRFAQIAGRPAEALPGSSLLDIVHPDDRERDLAAFRHMIETGAPFEMEKRYVQGDGSRRLGQLRGRGHARRVGAAHHRERHRPRRDAAPARRAGLARVGGASAPGGRERARVRDPVDRSRAPRDELESWRRRAHRLSRERDPRPSRRPHLHGGRPHRRRPGARGTAGACRWSRIRRALAPAQERQSFLGQRRDDVDARERRRRVDRPAQDLPRPDPRAHRLAGSRDQSRRAGPGARRQPARTRRGRGGEPCQGPLPGDPLARVAHAAHAGGAGAARARAQHRAAGAGAQHGRADPQERQGRAAPDRRPARRDPDLERQARDGERGDRHA